MARRTKEEAEKTREDILNAALELFCTKGYSKTTFDDIAKSIYFTKGAVYWHFRNKPDLLAALICKFGGSRIVKLSKSCDPVENLEDFKNFFVMIAKDIKKDKEHRKFLFFLLFQMEWSEKLFAQIRNSVNDIADFPLKHIKETLTLIQKSGEIGENTNINDVSLIVLSVWKGLLSNEIAQIHHSDDFPLIVKKAFEILIKGLKEEK